MFPVKIVLMQKDIHINEIKISNHGYVEIAYDKILIKDIIAGVKNSQLIEEYPDFQKGPCMAMEGKKRQMMLR